jgi:hypothetical protein
MARAAVSTASHTAAGADQPLGGSALRSCAASSRTSYRRSPSWTITVPGPRAPALRSVNAARVTRTPRRAHEPHASGLPCSVTVAASTLTSTAWRAATASTSPRSLCKAKWLSGAMDSSVSSTCTL